MKEESANLYRENEELRKMARDNHDKDGLINGLQARVRDLENQLRGIQGENVEVHTRIRSISEQNENFKKTQDHNNR